MNHKTPKFFLILNCPDETSIKQMSLAEAKAKFHDTDGDEENSVSILEIPHGSPFELTLCLDIMSETGEIIAMKGGDEEPIDIEDNRVYIKAEG